MTERQNWQELHRTRFSPGFSTGALPPPMSEPLASVQVTMSLALAERLRQAAVDRGMSRSELIRLLLARALEEGRMP